MLLFLHVTADEQGRYLGDLTQQTPDSPEVVQVLLEELLAARLLGWERCTITDCYAVALHQADAEHALTSLFGPIAHIV